MEIGTYLEQVSETILRYGWVSRAQARDADEGGALATADRAYTALDSGSPLAVSGFAVEEAREALLWARRVIAVSERCAVDGNDWWTALASALAEGTVTASNSGILASLIRSYRVEQARERDRALLRRHVNDSDHLGDPGEVLDVTALVISKDQLESTWGTRYRVRMAVDGNLLSTTGNAKALHAMQPGKVYPIRCRVRDHRTWLDIAETVVERVQLVT